MGTSQQRTDQPIRTACKGPDCDAHFMWVECIKRDGTTGRVPLNEGPIEIENPLDREQIRGTFVFIENTVVRAAVAGDKGPFFQSHFHTCPNADEFRRRG